MHESQRRYEQSNAGANQNRGLDGDPSSRSQVISVVTFVFPQLARSERHIGARPGREGDAYGREVPSSPVYQNLGWNLAGVWYCTP